MEKTDLYDSYIPGSFAASCITMEDLKKVAEGGRIVGMDKNLLRQSYIIDILFQHKVRTCTVTPETYYQLSVGMDLPLHPFFTGTNA